jgi:hypothetical protein
MTPSELAAKQVDVLLVSYKAIKDEIARRSALQWAILAGYAFFLYNAFSAILKSNLSPAERIAWATATWATSALALLFHRREQLEIMRLSRIISQCVGQELKNVGFGEVLFEGWGLGNGNVASSLYYNHCRAASWERVFNIAIFFGGPSGLSVIVVVQVITARLACVVAAAVIVTLVSSLSLGYLLQRGEGNVKQ